MKICIDARVVINEKTGIGNYAFNLIKSLLKIDHENDYLIYVFSGLNKNHPLHGLNQENLTKRIVNLHPVKAKHQIMIRRLLTQDNPDVYHYPNWDVPIFHNSRTVFTIHDLTYLLHKNFYAKYSFLKRIYTYLNIKYGLRRAAKIISVSETTRNDLQKIFKVPNNNVKVIYESLENRFFEKCAEEQKKKVTESFGIKGKYFLFVGERRPHKNLPRLIQAFEKFQRENENYSLVIAGRTYAIYREDLNEINRLNLAKKVIVLNYVNDDYLPVLFQAAEAFLFVSLYEGFGIPVLEAMASNTPVITSNISATDEIAGDAALKVNPYDVADIAKALRLISSDEKLKQKLIAKGKERAKLFSWEKTARETLSVYEEING